MLVSDVDTVWLRDPRPFFKTERVATESDVAVSTDCLSHALERQNDGCWHMQFNTGVLWLRPTATTTRFVGEWRDALLETEHEFEHDQDIFNRLLRVERDGTKPGFRPFRTNATTSQSLRVAARGVAVGALPLSLFCGGHVYFVQRLHETLRVRPLVVHTTYQFSQARGKRQRLREHGLWVLDDAAYYGGFEKGESESDGPSAEQGRVSRLSRWTNETAPRRRSSRAPPFRTTCSPRRGTASRSETCSRWRARPAASPSCRA